MTAVNPVPDERRDESFIAEDLPPEDVQSQDSSEEESEDPGAFTDEDEEDHKEEDTTMVIPAKYTTMVEALEGKIKAVQAKLDADATNALSFEEADLYAGKLPILSSDFRSLFDQIWDISDTVDVTTMKVNQLELDDALDMAKLSVLKILKRVQPPPAAGGGDGGGRRSSGNHSPGPSKTIHLPKPTIPKFDGQWRNWLGFKDLFETTVLNQDDDRAPPRHPVHTFNGSKFGQSVEGALQQVRQ